MVAESQFVPKVHPGTRSVEAEDPLELMAMPATGDPEVMLECLVQEFVWMGWDEEQLMALFDSPLYPVLSQLRECFGTEEVRRRLRMILSQQGLFRVRETIDDTPQPEPEEPELVQIEIRSKNQ